MYSKTSQISAGMIESTALQIETGRYIGLKVEERICRSCNTRQVENEQHFCVGCPALEVARAAMD